LAGYACTAVAAGYTIAFVGGDKNDRMGDADCFNRAQKSIGDRS